MSRTVAQKSSARANSAAKAWLDVEKRTPTLRWVFFINSECPSHAESPEVQFTIRSSGHRRHGHQAKNNGSKKNSHTGPAPFAYPHARAISVAASTGG